MPKKKKTFAEMKKETDLRKQGKGLVQSKAPEVIQQRDEIKQFNLSGTAEEFPLPIKNISVYKEDLLYAKQIPFIVCSFFTPNEMKYYKYAQRLLMSCEKFGLPYSIYQVSDVHRSIKLNGSDDLAFTKANFIAYNLARFHDKNILYLDVDVLFVEYPEMIVEISRADYDLAIYNWLADENNTAYSPIFQEIEGKIIATEIYKCTHHYQYYCPNQLTCSGGVQFYRNCSKIKNFLEAWQNVIAQNPHCADDECLDYTYNNMDSTFINLRPVWLDKSYLRLSYWPHIKPVILHPNWSEGGSKRTSLENRFYPENCQERAPSFIFPPDCLIDTKKKMLIKIKDAKVIDKQKIDQDFWIYQEDIE